MKKYFSLKEYKIYNKKRAKKSLEARQRFKDYKENKNSKNLGKQKDYRHSSSHPFKDYKKIYAPTEFSLITNPEEVISFICELHNCFENRKKVFVVLRYVEKIDYDAIIVLLSIMIRFKAMKIRFNGDFPIDSASERRLKDSGFFNNLYKTFEDRDTYYLSSQRNNFITHASKEVNSNLTAQIIENAAEKIWGEPKRCMGVQTTLNELAQNTVNWASFQGEGEQHWWLSINYSPNDNKVRFSFVDYGVGIFKSLDQKNESSKFFGVLNKMWEKFKYGSNAELLRLILNGELHRTISEEYYRGQGLPGLLDSLEENWFSKLYIITNDVYANIEKDKYTILRNSFNGTFIYWEIDSNSKHFEIEK
ncbi:MAG TPA: hypothetical protein VF596_13640 [Pyrinomonadaceae bacterium]|jgi:hypothetical protein